MAIILFNITYAVAFEQAKSLMKEGAKLTLSDCIQIALDNSPIIKKSAYNYKMAKNNVSISKTAFFPTIGVNTGYYYNGSHSNRMNSDNKYYNLQTNLNQLIWNFGKTNAQVKMQKFYTIASLYNFDSMVLETIFDVKTNYYGVLAAKASMEINRANVYINERNY